MTPPPDDAKSHRTVLQLLSERTGLAPKVFLSDSNSEHGASPVVDPLTATAKLVPQGRGNYQLLGEIARGGMGVILKGHDTDLGRDVAVKVLDKDLARNPAVVQRFIEEAQIGGQLQHPGIVPVYELGLMADDSPYFTMKLVKGRTLAALLRERTSPNDNRGRLLAIFESVCQTMAYAHSKGVLHRDLKPANIMVGAFGEVQVVDWGLAKVLHRGGVADERRAKETIHTIIETVRSGPGSSGSDSMVGSVMGTPAYMAPEQAQGEVEKLDERADVFSLGAILCELLTGTPPYVEIEGEPIVTQAAHARLDPARARIEACDADPALVRLCLACLMPARAARPANAEAVAKSIHAYVTSIEERARTAEVAAVEARVKAAEERRARRLTLALAGTVVIALLATGGGVWWVNHERAQRAQEQAARAEQTRAAVDVAHGESIELHQAGKHVEALASARRALSLAQTGAADDALLERAVKFVAKAELDVGAAERERALVAQDEALRSRLIDLRLEQIATIADAARAQALDRSFTQAFHEYGVDLEGDELVSALQRIRERAIAEDVALALDDWARLRRNVHGARSPQAESLYSLAMDLDPNPARKRLREAIASGDRAAILALASPEHLPELDAGSIFILSAELWGDGSEERRPAVYAILAQALALYPGDYVLQAVAGNFHSDGGQFESALACRTTALALRPNDLTTRVNLGEIQYFFGRLTDAQNTLRACVAAEPTNARANYFLGLAQTQLGDHAAALASFVRAPGIETDPSMRPDLHAAQYTSNVITRDDLVQRMDREYNPDLILSYLMALLAHPDREPRDAELVLHTLETRIPKMVQNRWRKVLEAIARVHLEDWNGALDALEHRYKRPWFLILTPAAHEFLRSLVYSKVGRHAEGRTCFERGMVAWNDATAVEPMAWERSDAMLWRRAAEAALAQ